MLSRHFLRSKVLQAIYAAEANPSESVFVLKRFDSQIDHLNMLGIWQLSILPQLASMAQTMLDEGKEKFMPSKEDLNPIYKLPQNRFIRMLADNYDLRSFSQRYCVNWGDSQNVFRQLFVDLRQTSFYRAYIAESEEGKDESYCYNADHQFAIQLFKYVINYELLRGTIEERHLLWEDDFDQLAQYNYMMLKAIGKDFSEATPIPLMFDKREQKDVEGYEFSKELLLNTLHNRKENDELIRKHLNNWEFERIALMDVLLLNMAVNEVLYCPSIPERVTVDEYIELSKDFSSEKSKLFINGILDRIMIELRMAGRIKKTGRGLYVPTDNEK